MKNEWISVKDRLPQIKSGGLSEPVLGYRPCKSTTVFCLVSEFGKPVYWQADAGFSCSLDSITLWMPLPEPPIEESNIELLKGFNKGKEAVKDLLFSASNGHDEDRELFILSLGQLFNKIDELALETKETK